MRGNEVNILRLLCLAMLGAALYGCESASIKGIQNDIKGLFQSGKAEQDLAAGIRQYEEHNYSEAARSLQASLDAGLSGKPDQVKAHKYLAFIHCVSGRERQCRDEFRKALKIDPAFELEPAEAGHPTWGPVFRGAKGRR